MHRLKPSPKVFQNYKCAYPSQTIERIIKAFRRIGLTPQYEARQISSNGVSIHSGTVTLPSIDFCTNGKGTSYLLAKASAFAELAERFSSVALLPFIRQDKQESAQYYRHLDSYDFKHHSAIMNPLDVIDWLQRKRTLSVRLKRKIFDDPRMKHWIKSYCLNHSSSTMVPIEFVWSISRTNGLAAGNTLEEAISQALCEVIERHVAAQWIVHKHLCPNVRPNSIIDSRCRKYIDLFHSLGRDIIIKDLSLAVGYPAIGLISINPRLQHEKNPFLKKAYRRINVGCSPNITHALLRCFTEELQGYTKELYMNAGTKLYTKFWEKWCNFDEQIALLHSHDYSRYGIERLYDLLGNTDYLDTCSEWVDFSTLPSYDNFDALDDIKTLCSLLAQNNFHTHYIDFTHPTLNIPVAQVIVPGMSDMIEYFHPTWLSNFGIEDYLLSTNMNLLPYASNSKWTRSRQGIREVLDLLERRFQLHGIEDNICCGSQEVWLFYIAYRLSLFLQEYAQAFRYLSVIRSDYQSDDTVTSEQMLVYLESRSRDNNHAQAINHIKHRYGISWCRKINLIINKHDLKNTRLINPFINISFSARALQHIQRLLDRFCV